MKDQDIDIVELGVASVETLGQERGGIEGLGFHQVTGLSDDD